MKLSLSEWSQVAQIILVLITFIGILISIWLSTKALREVQADRKTRQKPLLAFEQGGGRYPLKFIRTGTAVPGVEPAYAKSALPNIPADAESVRINEPENPDGTIKPIPIGSLKNFGTGTGLSVKVSWVPKEIWIGNEKFVLDQTKLAEPIYDKPLNTMPTYPSHILPGGQACLTRLPTFIEKDYEKKITRVDGVLEIISKDVFGDLHMGKQIFRIFPSYKEASPTVIITFSEMLEV